MAFTRSTSSAPATSSAPSRRLFGSKAREQVWQLECMAAHKAGRGRYPICVHCDIPVQPGDAWDRSHITVPQAFGGKSVGVGHRLCNQLDNNRVVTPAVAKAEAVRKKHLGIDGPGLGRAPMRFGRRSGKTATMNHGIQPRFTQGEKHKALMAARYGCFEAARNDNAPEQAEPFARPSRTAQDQKPDPLADLTDGLMLGDLAEDTFASCAAALGTPLEEVHDLIRLARVSTEMAVRP